MSETRPLQQTQVRVKMTGMMEKPAEQLSPVEAVLNRVENFEVLRDGEFSVRPGYCPIPTNSVLTSPNFVPNIAGSCRRLFASENRLLAAGPFGLYQYSNGATPFMHAFGFNGSYNPCVAESRLPTVDSVILGKMTSRLALQSISTGDSRDTYTFTDVCEGTFAGSNNPQKRYTFAAQCNPANLIVLAGQTLISSRVLDADGNVFDTTTQLADLPADGQTGGPGGSGPITNFRVFSIGSTAFIMASQNGIIWLFYRDVSGNNSVTGMSRNGATNINDYVGGLIDVAYDHTGAHPYAYILYKSGATQAKLLQIDATGAVVSSSTTGLTTTSGNSNLGVQFMKDDVSTNDIILCVFVNTTVDNRSFVIASGVLASSIHYTFSTAPTTPAGDLFRFGIVKTSASFVGGGGFTNYNIMILVNRYGTQDPIGCDAYTYTLARSISTGGATILGSGFMPDCIAVSNPVRISDNDQILCRFIYSPFSQSVYPGSSLPDPSGSGQDTRDFVVDVTSVISNRANGSDNSVGLSTMGKGHVVCDLAAGLAVTANPITNFGPSTPAGAYQGDCFVKNMQYSGRGYCLTGVEAIDALEYSTTNGLSPWPKRNVAYVYKLNLNSPYNYIMEQAPEAICSSGGIPCYVDSTNILDAGFPVRPAIIRVDNPQSGSFTGVYKVVAIFQHVDADGNVHWSAASNPCVVTLSSGKIDITISLPCLSRRNKPISGSSVLLFRSAPGLQAYYLDTEFVIKPASGASSVKLIGGFSTSDATITSQAPLYYQPGQSGTPLARQGPPSLRFVIVHKDRLAGIDDLGNIRYTGPYVPGEGQWWSDLFQIPVPGGTGLPTALASLSGHLVVFKSDSIFVIDGDGPPENGGNGTEFTQPQNEVSGIGCIDPRSVIQTTNGVYFRSHRGIEILSSNLNVNFIGEAVQDTVRGLSVIGGVTYCSNTDTVKFVMSSLKGDYYKDVNTSSWSYLEEPLSGLCNASYLLCFYQKSGAWTVHYLPGADSSHQGAQNAQPVSDIEYTNIYGKPQTILSTGHSSTPILSELRSYNSSTPFSQPQYFDVYTSGSTGPIYGMVETAWLKLGDTMDSKFRLYKSEVFGIYNDQHSLNIALAYDFTDTFTDTRVWAITSPVVPQIFQVSPSRERQYGVKMRVQTGDIYTTISPTIGSSVSWLGMAFNIGPKQGLPNIPAVQKG